MGDDNTNNLSSGNTFRRMLPGPQEKAFLDDFVGNRQSSDKVPSRNLKETFSKKAFQENLARLSIKSSG
jgi:hypothetical protein